jgi:hypothetical protein
MLFIYSIASYPFEVIEAFASVICIIGIPKKNENWSFFGKNPGGQTILLATIYAAHQII